MTAKRNPASASSRLVDKQLETYRSMRDFAITAEPDGSSGNAAGKKSKAAGKSNSLAHQDPAALPFVIQKHAASHLHYDFRLGWKGVLKSWAVAKGPSYVTKDKRLAVPVEDHPIEYGGFEGIIPEGQYGGGTVLLWDSGTWEPQPEFPDVDAGLRDGSLKFILHGKKLKGKWALIRMGGRAANAKKPQWLLIKEHDEFERAANDPAITEQAPESVVTGRDLEQIADQQDHVWNSKGSDHEGLARSGAGKSKVLARARSNGRGAVKSLLKPGEALRARDAQLADLPVERIPAFIPPQLAIQAKSAPRQAGWIHELKLDGYRIQARKDGKKITLLTRTGLDWTHRMKDLARDLATLPADKAILDGEVVVLSSEGTTSFADLQAAFQEGKKHSLTYFAFDLLHLEGRNLRGLPLTARKALLSSLLGQLVSDNSIRLSEHIAGDGQPIFEHACKLRAEGIISKRADSQYVSGRGSGWQKIKCIYEQEFVIGGFTLPSNGTHGVGALLLGYYDDQGSLIYAGRTGTGFTQKTHRLIRDQLDKLRVKSSGFKAVPSMYQRGANWVKPELVAQVGFASWTSDQLVRQAAFKGLREDKPPREVRRETLTGKQDNAPEDGPLDRAETADGTTRSASNSSRSAKRQSAKPGTQKGRLMSDAAIEHAQVRLTHPDKVLDDESKLTKQQLADYYWTIAEHLLPHIANRPLSLVRCPEGAGKPCFFQKHTSTTLPPGIETIDVPDKKTGKPEPYITLSTRESLAALAQMGVLELHPWGSKNNDLEHPDRIVIDLDPDESLPWSTLTRAARETRALLKQLGLETFLKGTGGKGLHVVAPIVPEHDWAVVKGFAHSIALQLEKQSPDLYLAKMSKAARKGKIYVDYLRNERGATSVAAFSPRARAGAPVSVPLAWKELDLDERPAFHVSDFNLWKGRLRTDPWKKMSEIAQRLYIQEKVLANK
jgi:bifunctional non-homologous end joining protein LigD